MDLELFDKLSELSPPVILGLFLVIIGVYLKHGAPIQGWLIPWILMALGALIYPMVSEVGNVSYNVSLPVAFNALIGACIGGAATGFHQGITRGIETFGKSKVGSLPEGDTAFLRKIKGGAPAVPAMPKPQ